MTAILDLIAWSAKWLQECKNTDQWARPWPDEAARDARVAHGIEDGLTWIVEDRMGGQVGTVTYRDQGNPRLWTGAELGEPAVYVSRLIVAREHAGRHIGASLLDWAGRRGTARWNARWIRVDVWTTNLALHSYYTLNGFAHLRTLQFQDNWEYPSAALFQKPTARVSPSAAARFVEASQRHGETGCFRPPG
jgi:GNAT superfamily N-acetyltransferase